MIMEKLFLHIVKIAQISVALCSYNVLCTRCCYSHFHSEESTGQ